MIFDFDNKTLSMKLQYRNMETEVTYVAYVVHRFQLNHWLDAAVVVVVVALT